MSEPLQETRSLANFRSHIYPFGGDHPRDGNCPRDGDCPNDSDHSIDGGYPCLLESSVSICHIIQYCEISPKKVGDHLWKMGDQKSIVTIRCNLAMSYNNGQRSLIFLNTTKQNEQTNKSHKAIY